jgi:2-keto-4-pentenoate hydratase/2-oxohepta-3-ene-1,7-dioic acid hydratase in catechol pathway
MPYLLANYSSRPDENIHAGVIVEGKIFRLTELLPEYPDSLQAAINDWQNLDRKLNKYVITGAGIPVNSIRLRAPSLEPSAIYFAGFNYRDHVARMMEKQGLAAMPDPKAEGIPPWHGQKPRNSLCGTGDTVELPTDSVDWEIELAVVIGRSAKRVSVEEALQYVAGYTVGIDLSARDRAFRPKQAENSISRMDWLAQKGFDGACPLGPWLVPSSQLPDPQKLTLTLSVNEAIKQDGRTSDMIFSVAETVAYLSSIVTLSPGDIILTGTPAGCGAETGEYLKKGDTIKASIQSIGELIVHLD